jgi:AcrR family transcriptional regulator
MSPTRPARPRGPRADVPDTRAALLEAATRLFAERGYVGTTLRDVAAEADVDVALVSYHFGGKDGLFAAAMELPVNPADVVAAVVAEGPDGIGERLLRTLLGVWEQPEAGGRFIALVRSAAGNEQAAGMLRGFVERELLGRIAASIDAPRPDLRAALAGSQIVGLIMARYVVRVEPLASVDADTLVAAIAPTLQRYLTGEL